MKKMIPLLLLLAVIGACNKEATYKENLEGTWLVYKYLFNNVDKTQSFQNANPGYNITFTADGKFVEMVTNPDTTYVNGTYSFEDNDQKIILVTTKTIYTPVFDSTGTVIIDTVETTKDYKRKYTIFNLTRDHVQLRNDTSQLYMNKPEVED